jgi:PAT family acetyl-CoA transporter-like MFS transporter 1
MNLETHELQLVPSSPRVVDYPHHTTYRPARRNLPAAPRFCPTSHILHSPRNHRPPPFLTNLTRAPRIKKQHRMARTRSSSKKPAPGSLQANNIDAKAKGTGTESSNSGESTMNNSVEYRRKQQAAPQNTRAIADNLISRPSFSLDEPVPATPNIAPVGGAVAHGFFDLPTRDRHNFVLLVLLYFLQGVPMGLATGSVPFLLKNHMSYSDIGIFSLASYPYSLKLLWSPIVDAMWSPTVGRRKSWILPIQVMSGIGMLFLGSTVEHMMAITGKEGGATVWSFTGWWFFLVFMCATQDIAVDGWALTLLTPTNVSYASTAQTVGLTAGQFLSYTVFLAFNSPDFANRYFRSEPLDQGIMTLSGYLTFWGWAYIAVTAGLALFKTEEVAHNEDGHPSRPPDSQDRVSGERRRYQSQTA